MAAGALLSLAIELLQTGVPGQVVDIDSILLNSVGVGLAHVAVVPAGRSGAAAEGGDPGAGGASAPGGVVSGSDPDDSQGRDRSVEGRFVRFVTVASKVWKRERWPSGGPAPPSARGRRSRLTKEPS